MTIAIGEPAKLAGVKVLTIRYYEAAALIPPPLRSDNNRRVYGDDAVRRLRFISHARDLGFEVVVIRELLSLAAQPYAPCQQADDIALRHLAEIDRKIARLTALRAEVSRMTEECGHGPVADCRAIEVLADRDECLSEAH